MKTKLTMEGDMDEAVDRIRYVEKHDSDCYKDRWQSLDRGPSHYYLLFASFQEVLHNRNRQNRCDAVQN